METSKKRIKRDYAPLNVGVSVVCSSPGSLPTQVYNAAEKQFEADRTLTPCVLSPLIVASANDGSWPDPHANGILSEMVWTANGENIAKQKEWEGAYRIDNGTGASRGALHIKKNVPPGTVYAMRFEGVVSDPRLGVNIPVKSDPVLLSTNDKAGDTYSLSIGDSQVILYDPTKDKLGLYEYRVAHGIIPADESKRAALEKGRDGYLCHIPLTVYKGKSQIESGYAVKLYEILNGKESEVTEKDHMEILAVNQQEVIVDLRLVDKKDYTVKIVVDNEQVAQEQFSFGRVYPKFRCRPTNGTGIKPGDTERYDVAMVDVDGNLAETPDLFLRIVWKTDTDALKNVKHNEGSTTLFRLADTGVGTSFNDDWIDVYTEAEYKSVHSVATDEDGSIYVDENGNTLIFN